MLGEPFSPRRKTLGISHQSELLERLRVQAGRLLAFQAGILLPARRFNAVTRHCSSKGGTETLEVATKKREGDVFTFAFVLTKKEKKRKEATATRWALWTQAVRPDSIWQKTPLPMRSEPSGPGAAQDIFLCTH